MSDLESGGDSASVVFRDLRREDVPPLMSLQQQLFPVQYTQSFYDRLFGHYRRLHDAFGTRPGDRRDRPVAADLHEDNKRIC